MRVFRVSAGLVELRVFRVSAGLACARGYRAVGEAELACREVRISYNGELTSHSHESGNGL